MKDRSSADACLNSILGYLEDEVVDEAWAIMDEEGSVARMRVKCGESSRDMRPWPQPRSMRREEGPRW